MSFSPILGNPKPQYEDSNGAPYVGMRLFFYTAGTDTKQDTFTDSSGGTANTNPLVIAADGYATGGVGIYGSDGSTYKVIAAPPGSDDPPTSTLWTLNSVTGNTGSEWPISFAATYISTTSFSVAGDQTASFVEGREIYCTGGADRYATIDGAVYGTVTTVTVRSVNTGANPPVASTLHASMDTVYLNINSPNQRALTGAQGYSNYEAVNAKTINVLLDFDARSSDITTAFQAAIDAASDGDTIEFPKDNYSFGLVDLIDKENITIEFNGSTITAIAGTPAYLLKIQNTTTSFLKGPRINNVYCSGTCTTFFHIDGGAWTNAEFNRVFSDDGVATYLIYYNNTTSPARNPSNFKFDTVWNKSYSIKYCIYYTATAGSNFDNFSFNHILHWSNQTTPSTLYFNGAGGQYSEFNNIYGALYATSSSVIGMSSGASIIRSTIKHVLMEGSQDTKNTLAGNYVECEIRNVVNYYTESLYTANYAFNGKAQYCQMFNCLLQDSGTGYSTLPSVVLDANSHNTLLTDCHVITNGGYQNRVVGLPHPPAYSVTQRQSYTTTGTKSLITLKAVDFNYGDIITIKYTGGSTGAANKTIQLYEIGSRLLGTVTSVAVAAAWWAEVTYVVYNNGGTKSVICHAVGSYSTGITLNSL